MSSDKYILIDLERSISSGRVVYWKNNNMGYTIDPATAGRYDKETALSQVEEDHNKRTACMPEKEFIKLLGQ